MPQKLFAVLILAASVAGLLHAVQNPSGNGVPVQMVVTAEPKHGNDTPMLHREDIMVYQGRDRDQVTGWEPFQGANAALELFILIDDSLGSSVANQLADVRAFITEQPPTTAIGIGYMRNGTVQMVQNLTTDHAAAANHLRIPIGAGATSDPYDSLGALLKEWSPSTHRREVIMISNGIEPFGPETTSNPIVSSSIEAAQRAGVPVFTVYSTGDGHLSHSFWRNNWAQTYLSQLAEETGGESYNFINQNVSFAPYLQDIAKKLNHQYRLTFLAKPKNKSGIERVRITTEVPGVDLIAADGVYVPAGM
jgi:hypothetical protein